LCRFRRASSPDIARTGLRSIRLWSTASVRIVEMVARTRRHGVPRVSRSLPRRHDRVHVLPTEVSQLQAAEHWLDIVPEALSVGA
jgi:hypothetical protein